MRKKDAQDYETEFLRTKARSCDMAFGSFVEIYIDDMTSRLKKSTMSNKRWLIDTHVLPFFRDLPLNEITAAHVRKWQAKILTTDLKPTYIKTINNQLSAIFNYAVKFYGLPTNPCRVAGSIGKKNADTMKFWTVDQFDAVLPLVKKYPARVGLEVLFWTGMRIGELLALCSGDFDFVKQTVSITKGFQTVEGEEITDSPKTPKSTRTIKIPDKLSAHVQEYIGRLFDYESGDRLFPFTKSYFKQQKDAGAAAAGVEVIRIHDLRHSHAALLIELGVPILLISERLGHEDVETTLRTYGHLYPNKHDETVQKLDDLMK